MANTTLFFIAMASTILSLEAAQPVSTVSDADGGDALTIRLYNYAGIDAALILEAAEVARTIYRRSGVETRWVLCELTGVETELDRPCAGLQSPDTLQMRIVAAAPKEHDGINHIVFGFALPQKDGFGSLASAFWDRIVETAEQSKVTSVQLLATVMAHEAGHLLLGFNSHTGQGLMSGRWNGARFTKISQGSLSFVGAQRKRIRAAAHQRLLAAARR